MKGQSQVWQARLVELDVWKAPGVKQTARWVEDGWGHRVASIDVSSIDELTRAISRIATLRAGRTHLWRGVADHRWRLRSTLVRKVLEAGVPLTEDAVRAAERDILRRAREWGIGTESTGLASDLHVDHTHTTVATGPAGDPLPTLLSASAAASRPFLLEPSVPDPRMSAQAGLFLSGAVPAAAHRSGVDGLPLLAGDPPGADRFAALFGVKDRAAGRPSALPFVALVVDPRLKAQVLAHVETSYSRTRRQLFPDVGGFVDDVRLTWSVE